MSTIDLAMHNNPLMGERYNLPAFITMSIMQSMVASRMSALGQSDLPPKVEIGQGR